VVLVACTLVALVLTGSRAAYIGLAAAMIYQAIRWMREGRQRQIVAVSLIGAVAVLIALSVSVTVEATQHVGVLGRVGHGASDADIATRLREWRKTMPLIEASPFVGIGFSRWADVLPDRLTFARVDIHDNRFAGFRGLVWLARRFPVNNADISAHSSYMTRLSEIGVIGVLLLGWFWIAVWRRERSLGAERGWDLPELAAAAQACIVFVAVCAFFEDGFGAPGIGLPLALIVGLSLASRRSSRPPGRAQTEDSGGIAVVALGRAAGR